MRFKLKRMSKFEVEQAQPKFETECGLSERVGIHLSCEDGGSYYFLFWKTWFAEFDAHQSGVMVWDADEGATPLGPPTREFALQFEWQAYKKVAVGLLKHLNECKEEEYEVES